MRDLGEPVGAGGPVVVARRYLRRRLVVDLVLLGVAALLLGAGVGGFVFLGVQSGRLAHDGVVATATAIEVDNYTRRFQFDAHVVVTFRVAGEVVEARCYTGPGDQFVVGQPVVVVYDPDDPTTAQLAGDPQLGPAGVAFLGLVVLGILVALPGAYGVWTRRGAGKALGGSGREMTARRAGRRTALGDELTVRLHGRRPDGPVTVFGDRTIVAVGRDHVAVGRR
ncbi:MAG TPA: DUF3592 domain-containing protein [Pseudonocardiaceae bacterium]|nr:DUF3592 domain-containing protein [Pseudonocardiaceae bacterium]